VSVYLPSLDVARAARALLAQTEPVPGEDPAVKAFDRAIARRESQNAEWAERTRERLAGQPGAGGTGASEAKGA
jgi:hypothetical protein